MSANASTSTNLSVFAGLVFSPFTIPLMTVVQNMIKPFYIGKPFISTNNTLVLIYIKRILWIGGVSFLFLDDDGQYILTIPNELQRLEVAKNVAYQQVLLAEKIGGKHENMTMLLKQD